MDIDIDFADRTKALELFKHIPARRIDEKNKVVKHNTGVYFQKTPFDPINGLCDLDYKTADNEGYFKIDFLNVSIYKDIKSEDHLIELMEREPLWDLLEQEEVVDELFHINGHVHILQAMKPKSIEQLAAVLAIIRPAKRHLLGKTWSEVFSEIWTRPSDGSYYFKKSHAVAYAIAVVVQFNLLCENLIRLSHQGN